jgi:hypothetical protein
MSRPSSAKRRGLDIAAYLAIPLQVGIQVHRKTALPMRVVARYRIVRATTGDVYPPDRIPKDPISCIEPASSQ